MLQAAPLQPKYGNAVSKSFEPALAQRRKAGGIEFAQFTHEPGYYDAVGFGFGTQTGGEMHRGAEQVVVIGDWLAGMQTDADI
jgi:hypothetical protein